MEIEEYFNRVDSAKQLKFNVITSNQLESVNRIEESLKEQLKMLYVLPTTANI